MGNDLRLRRWRPEDCRTLFDWRMHPAIRRWCGDQGEIAPADHQRWFDRFLYDPARFGFMLEETGKAVAQIRFDPAEVAGCYRISLAAAPEMSGRGLGSHILRQACADKELLNVASLFIAETFVENLPSQKIFSRNGFSCAGPTVRRNHEMLCWMMPSGRISDLVKIQIHGPQDEQEELEKLLKVTGLADVSEDASVRFFFDAAASDADFSGSMVFHLNLNGANAVLDLALRAPVKLELPIVFDNRMIAVAQIVAGIRHSFRSGKF